MISWSSAGASGFQGRSQRPPLRCQTAAESRWDAAPSISMRQMKCWSGPRLRRGNRDPCPAGGRFWRSPMIPRWSPPCRHNGCPPSKRRRVESVVSISPRLHQPFGRSIPPSFRPCIRSRSIASSIDCRRPLPRPGCFVIGPLDRGQSPSPWVTPCGVPDGWAWKVSAITGRAASPVWGTTNTPTNPWGA